MWPETHKNPNTIPNIICCYMTLQNVLKHIFLLLNRDKFLHLAYLEIFSWIWDMFWDNGIYTGWLIPYKLYQDFTKLRYTVMNTSQNIWSATHNFFIWMLEYIQIHGVHEQLEALTIYSSILYVNKSLPQWYLQCPCLAWAPPLLQSGVKQ